MRDSEGRPNTARSIYDQESDGGYPHYLGFQSTAELIDWLRGSRILDVGSGYGMFAKSFAQAFPKDTITKIFSLNLSLKDKPFRDNRHTETARELGVNDPEELTRLNKRHDELAVAARWDRLPYKDESFERIVSVYGFPRYAKTEEELRGAIRELARVLKPGGEIRLSPIGHANIDAYNGSSEPRKKLYILKEYIQSLGLNIEEIKVRPANAEVRSIICWSIKKTGN